MLVFTEEGIEEKRRSGRHPEDKQSITRASQPRKQNKKKEGGEGLRFCAHVQRELGCACCVRYIHLWTDQRLLLSGQTAVYGSALPHPRFFDASLRRYLSLSRPSNHESRIRFYEYDGSSEWGGTDLTGAAMGGSIMGPEFPLRKGMGGASSRFSAGPRSQVIRLSVV